MNSDEPNNLQPWSDPELEARVVALVLGEASDFEREDLERLLAEEPELRLFKERIEEVHRMLGEQDGAREWKLSDARRQKVLAVATPEVMPSRKRPWWMNPAVWAAACLVVTLGILSSWSFPAYSYVSPRSREMARRSEERQAAILAQLNQADEEASRRAKLAQASQESRFFAESPMSTGIVGSGQPDGFGLGGRAPRSSTSG